MPAGNEGKYAQITLRVASVLNLVARGHSYEEISVALALGARTVASEASKAESLTGCLTYPELMRWWQDNEPHWARWWLDRLGIDPQDLVG
jgi:DNA-binding CsgD family transcriptional regulator